MIQAAKKIYAEDIITETKEITDLFFLGVKKRAAEKRGRRWRVYLITPKDLAERALLGKKSTKAVIKVRWGKERYPKALFPEEKAAVCKAANAWRRNNRKFLPKLVLGKYVSDLPPLIEKEADRQSKITDFRDARRNFSDPLTHKKSWVKTSNKIVNTDNRRIFYVNFIAERLTAALRQRLILDKLCINHVDAKQGIAIGYSFYYNFGGYYKYIHPVISFSIAPRRITRCLLTGYPRSATSKQLIKLLRSADVGYVDIPY